MPIKPPNQSNRVLDTQGFVGRRGRDRKSDYSKMNESPQTYKTDREPAKKGDRLYDTKGFNDALKKIQKEFGSRINPGK